jgi:signal transduction histidine kinase
VVRVARDRRNVLLSVQDTGMGIAKEDIPRVFSRFWRSDASREREAGGLGVGLSLTKEIVDRHNGTISVDSEEGVGTTFTLHIPLARKKTRK